MVVALQPHVPVRSSTSKSAGSANAAQPSMQETEPTAAEGQRISDLQEQFQQQAQKDPAGFRFALREAFGDKASLAGIDQLLDLALSGKLPMPSNIKFVEAGSLCSGALGAYDASNGGSLYMDRSLLSDPEKLQSVFNEEMGHHLDALLGGSDAAGDEGAVFSRTLEQGALSDQELSALKNEDDHGVIQLGDRWVQVEFHEEGGTESGGTESGGTESGGTESGGASSGSTESESDGDTSDTGGECSVDGNYEGGGTPGTDGPDDNGKDGRDENKSDHQNGNSDPDKTGDAKGTDSTGDQKGDPEPASAGDTSEGDNGTIPGDDEETQSKSGSGTTPDEDSEPEPEPEEQGFWSSAWDAVSPGWGWLSGDSSDGETENKEDEGGLFGQGGLLGLGWSGDVFVGFDVDLTGAYGFEFGAGVVIDFDTPIDSGLYGTQGYSGGANIGIGVGIGYGWGDIEGRSVGGFDVNYGHFSAEGSFGSDGQPVIAGYLGVGAGASWNDSTTSTWAPFRRN